MDKKEHIVLDAMITKVISVSAFHATLSNGHELVAFRGRNRDDRTRREVAPGDRVQVLMSPYDMSNGQLIFKEENEL